MSLLALMFGCSSRFLGWFVRHASSLAIARFCAHFDVFAWPVRLSCLSIFWVSFVNVVFYLQFSHRCSQSGVCLQLVVSYHPLQCINFWRCRRGGRWWRRRRACYQDYFCISVAIASSTGNMMCLQKGHFYVQVLTLKSINLWWLRRVGAWPLCSPRLTFCRSPRFTFSERLST